jgi:tetratricopeptide (TPR) repeat protein
LRQQRLRRLRKLEVDCLSGLGVMARGQGRPTEAVTHLEAALAAATQLGDSDMRAGVLANLGAARLPLDRARATSELAESVALRERRVVEMHAAGERQGLATAILEHAGALISLASALYVGKRHREAAGAYERALDVFEAIGDGDKALGALVNLANIHELQMGDRDAAELEAHARAAAASRRRGEDGEGGGEQDEGVAVAGAARRRAAAFRRRLHDLAKEFCPERGEQEAECALCDEPLEEGEEEADGSTTKAAAPSSSRRRRRRRIIVLGCLHSHHEPCWRAWCERPGQPECPLCAKEVAAMRQLREQQQRQQEQQEQQQ